MKGRIIKMILEEIQDVIKYCQVMAKGLQEQGRQECAICAKDYLMLVNWLQRIVSQSKERRGGKCDQE